MDLYNFFAEQFGFFLLVFIRISVFFTTAPIYGSRNIPVIMKAGLALLLSYTLAPLLYSESYVIPDAFLEYILLVVGEALVGLMLGFVSSIFFSAIQMAGQLLDMQVGFGIVNVIDPQFGQQIPLIGNFKYILALLVFLATNGHHLLISALMDSFRIVPLTGAIFTPDLATLMIDIVFGMFIIALKIAFPVLAAILLSEIALAVLARTMPQLNIFVVGIPLKISVGLFMMFLTLPFYILFLEVGFNVMFQNMYRFLAHLH